MPSDECAIVIDGETYHPHAGEWVDLYRGQSVGELQAIAEMRRLGVDIQSLEGEPDAEQKALDLISPHFERLCGYLARRVVAWNWTDDAGQPLPQPDGTVEPLKALSASELVWILGAASGETHGERKNGLTPSPTISSDTDSLPTGAPQLTTDRSRTRRR